MAHPGEAHRVPPRASFLGGVDHDLGDQQRLDQVLPGTLNTGGRL
ncbi:hypothetical protein [Streptomyces sp. enrichment culture]